MNTYVLTVSSQFPTKHARAGEPTEFESKILSGQKFHTIRANYALWKKRIDEVNAGKAILSIRKWSGKPYYTKQVVIKELSAGECGIQKLSYFKNTIMYMEPFNIDSILYNSMDMLRLVAKNDGLLIIDFLDWFKGCTNEPMAIIHFANLRYGSFQV